MWTAALEYMCLELVEHQQGGVNLISAEIVAVRNSELSKLTDHSKNSRILKIDSTLNKCRW